MIRSAMILAGALAVAAPAAMADVIAIESATVHVRPGKTIENATVIVRDGAIAEVGEGLPAPAGARRIDADGRHVTAGFVDPFSRLGLVEVNSVSSTVEGRFSSDLDDSVHAAYRVIDGYNPRSLTIPVARTGGVTSAVAAPQGGLVAGAAAWVTAREARTVDEAAVRTPAAMIAMLGEGAIANTAGSRGMAALRLRELLGDAAEYAGRRAAYERGQSRPLSAERLALEAMQPVLDGDIPLVITAHRASDITVAASLAETFNVRVAVEGATEAWLVADELATAGIPVILDPIANLPRSFDRLHVRDDAAAILAEAGVEVAISTAGRASTVRLLRQHAGNAVARGLSWEDALAAVTTVPAAIYGVEDRGAIEPGTRADVVVWSGDPFEIDSHVEAMLIDGVEQSLRTRQTELLERYLQLSP